MVRECLEDMENISEADWDFAKGQESLTQSHSIDELQNEHTIKEEMEQELKDMSDADGSQKP
jgi:hypothetical protein